MRRPARARRHESILCAAIAFAVLVAGCSNAPRPTPSPQVTDVNAFLDDLEERTFRWFWDVTDSTNGLTPDRWPTPSFHSIAATGFALTAYPIGVERGWVSREAAARRTATTLRFLWTAPQDSVASGVIGYKGLFYHFLEPEHGTRFKDVELSTVDTALLFAGVLTCQSWFDGNTPDEITIRALADSLYLRADWNWASPRAPLIGHGWTPEEGHLKWDWRGYNEAMLVYIIALGSPTHAPAPAAWDSWLDGYTWGTFEGQAHVGFAPLFGHHYSHVWVDFRGIRDSYMQTKGIDYFENSRRATLSQRSYAIRNPMAFEGYGPDIWGLSACDGPVNGTVTIKGKPVEMATYRARGVSYGDIRDDGTIAPTAAGGSIPFAPEFAIPALMAMKSAWGEHGYN
ncbi:MAG TPA: glucoamylase family protein, partial [Candidatus Eisenbacteria bacterium]